MKAKWIYLVIGAYLITGTLGLSQISTSSEPINISNSNSACVNDDCRPAIAVRDGKVFVVWAEAIGSGLSSIFISSSDDGGNSFTIPQTIDASSATSARHPDIAVAANGDLMVVWSDNRSENFEIYAVFSKDNGITWIGDDNQAMLNLSSNLGDSTHPSLKINDFGVFAVAWSDDTRDEIINSNGARNIFFQVGLNLGQIELESGNLSEAFFPETVNISKRFQSSIRSPAEYPVLAMNPDLLVPEVFFAWQQEGTRNEEVFFHQSAGFNPINVSNSPNSASRQPSIALGHVAGFSTLTPQEVVLVWVEQSGSRSKILLNSAINGGINYNSPDFSNPAIEISQSTESATAPALTVNEQSEFFIAWESRDQFNRVPTSIKLLTLSNLLSPPIDISRSDENLDRNARNPDIAADADNVYVVWVSEIGLTKQSDIFFAKR